MFGDVLGIGNTRVVSPDVSDREPDDVPTVRVVAGNLGAQLDGIADDGRQALTDVYGDPGNDLGSNANK